MITDFKDSYGRGMSLTQLGRWGGLGICTYEDMKRWYDETVPIRRSRRKRMHRGLPLCKRSDLATMFYDRETGEIEIFRYFYLYTIGEDHVKDYLKMPSMVAKPNNTWELRFGEYVGTTSLRDLVAGVWGYKALVREYNTIESREVPHQQSPRYGSVLWVYCGGEWHAVAGARLGEYNLAKKGSRTACEFTLRDEVLRPVKKYAPEVYSLAVNRNQSRKVYNTNRRIIEGLCSRFKLLYSPNETLSFRDTWPKASLASTTWPRVADINALPTTNRVLNSAKSFRIEDVSHSDFGELVMELYCNTSLAHYGWATQPEMRRMFTPKRFREALLEIIRKRHLRYTHRREEITSPYDRKIRMSVSIKT